MINIKGSDVYRIVEETVPLYVAMLCGYVAVRWVKLFTPDQCAGINKFVSKFVLPLLSFKFIARSNPYKMNHKLLASDCVQKILALVVLVAVARLFPRGRLSWVITGMALLTLPNTLVLGIPMIGSMYGPETETLLIQIVVLQSLVWYNLLLFLFELNATRAASSVMPSQAGEGDIEMPSQDSQRQESNIANIEGLEAGDYEAPNSTSSTVMARRSHPKVVMILFKVAKKLLLNPNIYAALLGFIWAFIKFRWNLELPAIVQKSIDILADGGLGMAMFSLGLFMALRGRIIACGMKLAILAMVARFIIGVLFMAVPTVGFRMKGTLLRVLIIQAALPQGLVPFVFATEYNVHPDIMATGVIFGMLIALPVGLVYYILLSVL